MIRISQITLPPDAGEGKLREKTAALLGLSPEQLCDFRIVRRSIDARKKPNIFYVFTVECSCKDEEACVKRARSGSVRLVQPPTPYTFPAKGVKWQRGARPVIVGLGPAGLFAALFLARVGIPSVILERGVDVDRRSADVERFWSTGKLSQSSNVQFGEGGAGTFSDGKLTTGTNDPRMRTVLETLVQFGAPEEILYSHKPHVGTDVLRHVVKAIRMELVALGCEVHFEHRLMDFDIQNGRLQAALVEDREGCELRIPCESLILAPGHSARDTFSMLAAREVKLEQKPFAIGVRIEHKQAEVSRAQFGPQWRKVPPSDYKLVQHLPSGRSVFSFCVCPGGQVIAAASQAGQLVTNGMSRQARDGENINGALLVSVGPEDFPGEDPLAGVRFQEQWERAAWELGGKNFCAPVQLVGDFLQNRPSQGGGRVEPSYRPGVTWTDLRNCLPDYVSEALQEALPHFGQKVAGFAAPESVLTGVETRSSSPLRILRDGKGFQASVTGLYPCGEGAGYAGGIVSAAVDGIRVAEALAQEE